MMKMFCIVLLNIVVTIHMWLLAVVSVTKELNLKFWLIYIQLGV